MQVSFRSRRASWRGYRLLRLLIPSMRSEVEDGDTLDNLAEDAGCCHIVRIWEGGGRFLGSGW